jgi:hypothetical protein
MNASKQNGATWLNALSVEHFTDAKGNPARRWTKIGVAFPHKEGPGFNVELKALPIDGRVILLPPDTDDSADRATPSVNRRRSPGDGL